VSPLIICQIVISIIWMSNFIDQFSMYPKIIFHFLSDMLFTFFLISNFPSQSVNLWPASNSGRTLYLILISSKNSLINLINTFDKWSRTNDWHITFNTLINCGSSSRLFFLIFYYPCNTWIFFDDRLKFNWSLSLVS